MAWLRRLSLAAALALVCTPSIALAATQTVNDSLNVTATVYGPAPSTPAIITSPINSTTASVTPMVVSGTCGPGLTVRVFINNQLAGTTSCQIDGTFVVNITLAIGKNELTALNYDTLDQAGPTSATVVVYVSQPSTQTPTKRTRTPRSTTQSGTPQTTTPGDDDSGLDIPSGEGDGQSRGGEIPFSQVHAEWLLFFIDMIALTILGDIVLNNRRILGFIRRRGKRRKKAIF